MGMARMIEVLLSLLCVCQTFRVRKARKTSKEYVVTLGDSYSSGAGIHLRGREYDVTFGGKETIGSKEYFFSPSPELDCWRELNTTPGPKLAARWGKSAISLACKGAQIDNVEQEVDYLVAAYPAETKAQWDSSVIILTAGGNDLQTRTGLRWPDVITKCITETDFGAGCHEDKNHQPTNWKDVRTMVVNLLKKIAVGAPKAKVRFLGYPPLMRAHNGGWLGCYPGWATISGQEARWADKLVQKLNVELESAVSEVRADTGVDVKYVSAWDRFTKGACHKKPKHMQAVRILDGSVSHASFHPTQMGYDAFYEALVDDLE